MHVIGFFFDFDGTLAPLDRRREDLRVSEDNVKMLEILREKGFRTAVISSKDCGFLRSKIPVNLDGMACIYALEIRGGGYVVVDEKSVERESNEKIQKILSMLKALENQVTLEIKKVLDAYVGGIGIDWRFSGGRPSEIDSIIDLARSLGLKIYEYKYYPFLDIYTSYREKDWSVKILRTLLGVDKIVYLGDSENDLKAFEEADVRVLVRHKYNKHFNPDVDYIVEFDSVARWVLDYARSL
ncbi:MAG: hypothetical protein QXS89_00890 [Sulfolobales archaeon]